MNIYLVNFVSVIEDWFVSMEKEAREQEYLALKRFIKEREV